MIIWHVAGDLWVGPSAHDDTEAMLRTAGKQGRDAGYNDWYDRFHLADICAIPGIQSGRRFEATPITVGAPGLPYLSIFEVETDDPKIILEEMGKRAASGVICSTDALDMEASIIWFYKKHEVAAGSARR